MNRLYDSFATNNTATIPVVVATKTKTKPALNTEHCFSLKPYKRGKKKNTIISVLQFPTALFSFPKNFKLSKVYNEKRLL